MTDTTITPINFATPPAKILIIKPSSLGDIVHTLPFLAVLHQGFPNAEIHWLVAKGLHTFIEDHPLITKLWVIDKDGWKKPGNIKQTVTEISSLRRGLKQELFDVSIDLSGLLRSGLFTMAADARYKLGFSDSDEGSPFFYNKKIVGGDQIHAIDRYLKLASLLGLDNNSIEYPFANYNSRPAILETLPEKFCVMAPSAGKEANRWPAQRFGQLAASLSIPTVVISTMADKPVVDEVVAHSEGQAISLAGRTNLKELVALIARASYFISNDTGPMHIAAALKIPVFAIFGPANPVRTGPYGTIHTVIQEKLDCSPCYRQSACETWHCMLDITVENVLNIIKNSNYSC